MKMILKIIVMMVALVAVYALGVPPAVDSLDAVNFARGLADYDLARFQPHFPGYPLYVLAARLPHALGLQETWALALPGVLGVPAGLAVLYSGLRRRLGHDTALLAAGLCGVSPLVATVAARPGSDGLGLAVLLAGAGAVAGGWNRPTGVLLGLLPGVRLSYLPAAAILLMVPGTGRSRDRLVAAAATMLAWGLPFLAVVGPDVVGLGTAFLDGHLHGWGGTLLADAQLGDRLSAFSDALVVGGLGGWLAAATVVIGVALAGRFGVTLVALAAPYALWVFVLQDAADPRHSAPLLVAALVGAAVGCGRGGLPRQAVAALALTLIVPVAAARLGAQRVVPSPALQAAHWLETHVPAEGTEYAGGGEVRVINHRATRYRARRQADLDAVVADLASPPRRPARVLVSSGVAGASPGPGLTLLARLSGHPDLHREPPEIAIYRMRYP